MKPKIYCSLIAALILAAAGWYLFRPVTAADLLKTLPPGEAPTLYVNVNALRAGGLLEKIAGPAALEDPEYKRFVAATGFDYRQHLDAVLIRIHPNETFIVAAGSFDLDRLAVYAKANGGRCAGELCAMQGSGADKQISWTPVRRRVLGLVVSADPMAAALLAGNSTPAAFRLPAGPAWLHVPGPALKPGGGLPPGFSALLSALDGATYAQLSASGTEIVLEAPCDSQETAAKLADRLKETTRTLRNLLAREKAEANPLAATLAGGEFHAAAASVRGRWLLKW